MVNGAGLAMATMDVVKLYGGAPANFLDIGGGAGKDKVKAALQIILSDPNVKAVMFNIFGGITRVDEVARGIIAALDEVPEGEVRPTCLVELGDEVAALQSHPLYCEAPRLQLSAQPLGRWAEVRVAKDVGGFQRFVKRQLLGVPRVVLMQVPAFSVQQRLWVLASAVLEKLVVQFAYVHLDAASE